jgi:hypothetical protein
MHAPLMPTRKPFHLFWVFMADFPIEPSIFWMLSEQVPRRPLVLIGTVYGRARQKSER